MGIAALVLGIVAIVMAAIVPYYGWIAIILGICGIVLGAMGKKNGDKCATAGLILSVIGAALALAFWLACIACIDAVGDAFEVSY